MKKTLIALMALAGIAAAEDISGSFTWTQTGGYEFTFEDPVLTMSAISSDKVQKSLTTSELNLGTEEDPDIINVIGTTTGNNIDYLEVSTATSYAPDVNIGNSTTNSWTLTFTLNNDSDEDMSLYKMGFDVFLFNSGGKAQCADTIARPITLTLTQNNVKIGSVGVATAGNNWHTTATIALDDYTLGANSSATFALTVTNAQTKDVDPNQAGVQLAGTFVGLSGITVTVPEPTTATLSLLALAGLAARRRRK